MARPKSSTNKPKAAKPKKAKPASTPETTDFQPPFSDEIERIAQGGPLIEGETPTPKKVPKGNEGPCQACQQTSVSKVPLPHDGTLHYGTDERWCNAAGCRCQAYRP
jgi:hypothetical protein